MDPTANFRNALPIVLQPAEPALAALHALRSQSHDPARCSRCGSSLVHRSTVIRKKSSRVHRRSCRICDVTMHTLLTPSHFPSTRKHGAIIPQPAREPTPPLAPVAVPSQPSIPHTIKPRPNKKKSTLQQLLERNREKEQEQKKQKNTTQLGGLASFLSGL